MIDTLLDATLPDHPLIDLLRGVIATLGAAIVLVVVLVWLQRHLLPQRVRLFLAGLLALDVYVSARELHEIGRPFFLPGLPFALLTEILLLAYLWQLWQAGHGLGEKPL